MIPNPPQQQMKTIGPEEGFQYLMELVSVYLQELPPPVRGPVRNAVNTSAQVVGEALKERVDALTRLHALENPPPDAPVMPPTGEPGEQ